MKLSFRFWKYVSFVIVLLLGAFTVFGATSIEITTDDWINFFGNINLSTNNIRDAGNTSITGNLSVDGNTSLDGTTLYVDADANKVGIGTSSPSQLLHVEGDTNITGSLIVMGENVTVDDNISVLHGFNESGGNVVPVRVTETGALQLSVVENGISTLDAGATGVDLTLTGDLTIDTNVLYIDTANNKVGILTLTPSQELHVAGHLNATGTSSNSTFQGDVNILGTLYGGSPLKIGGGINISVPDGEDAFFVTDSSNNKVLRITNKGVLNITSSAGNTSFDEETLFVDAENNRVGVGTGSPNEVLEVVGDVLFNTTVGKGFFFDASSGEVGIGATNPSELLELRRANDGADTSLAIVNDADTDSTDETTDIIFALANNLDRVAKISVQREGAFSSAGTADSSMRFFNSLDGTPTEQLTILHTGNVGIGTTNPGYKLVVDGSLNVSNADIGIAPRTDADALIIEDNTAGGMSILVPDASAGNIRFGSPSDDSGAIITYTLDNDLMQIGTQNTGGELVFFSDNGVENMRLDSSGNLGIGQTTPNVTFGVSGDANISGTLSVGSFEISNAGAGTMNVSGNTLLAYDSGAVGIGTKFPTEKLVVIGNVSINDSSGDNENIIFDTTNDAILFTGENGSLYQPVYGSDDGLVLYLPFSENAINVSNQTYDRSPYGNDGALVNLNFGNTANGTGWSSGKYGNGMEFEGEGDYIDAGSGSSLNIANDITISAWVKLNDLTGTEYIAEKRAGSLEGWELQKVNDEFVFLADGGGTAGSVTTSINAIANRWYYIAATRSGSDFTIYVDGKSEGTGSESGSMSNSEPVTIGANAIPANFFNGSIDEVRIYRRALTPEEIRTHYLRGSGYGASGAITADKFRVVNTTGGRFFEINQTGFSVHTSGAERLKIDSNGAVFIDDNSANSKLTQGLSVKTTGTDEILSLKYSGTSHGITTDTETDTYGLSTIYHADDDGLSLEGYGSANTNGYVGLRLLGVGGRDLSSKSTSAEAAVLIDAAQKSGTTAGVMDANGNLLSIRDLTTTRFIFDAEGDLWTTGNITLGADGNISTASGNLILGSNVGIGTTTPTDPLVVSGAANVTGQLTVGAIGSGGISIGTSSLSEKLKVERDSNNVGVRITQPSTFDSSGNPLMIVEQLHTTDDDATLLVDNRGTGTSFIVTEDGGTTATLIVKDGGNTGVNDSSPAETLDVIGTFSVVSGQSGNAQGLFQDSSGNVGIGKTSPNFKLDVDGTINASGLLLTNGSFSVSQGGKIGVGIAAPTQELEVEGGVNISGGLNVTNGDVLLATSGGNVGIGTASPGDILDISSDSSDDSVIRMTSPDAAAFAAGLEMRGGSGGTQSTLFIHAARGRHELSTAANFDAEITTASSTNLLFGTNSAEAMRIDTSGNVGIGTTTPSELLTLQSSTSGKPRIFINNSNADANDAHISFGKYSSSPADGDNIGTLSFLAHDSGGTEQTHAYLLVKTEDVSDTTEDSSFSFFTRSAGAIDDPTMVIRSSNVGIGVNNPSATLHINESSGSATLNLDGEDGAILRLRSDRNADSTDDAKIAFYNDGDASGDATWAIGHDGSDSESFKISQGEQVDTDTKLTILTGGNVGIGTTTPTNALLELSGIAGTNYGDSTSGGIQVNTAGHGRIKINSSSTGGHAVAYQLVAGDDEAEIHLTQGTNYLNFRVGGTSHMVIENNTGNVGIGTTAPDSLLEIDGSSGVLLNVTNGASPLLSVESGGNVGIGVANPEQLLEIESTSGNALLELKSASGSDGGITLREGSTAQWTIFNDGDDSDKIKFYEYLSTDSVVMTIQQDGNVGIGTTGPAVELHVNGSGEVFRMTGTDDTSTVYSLFKTEQSTGQGLVGTEGSSAGSLIADTLAYATVLASTASGGDLQLGAAGAVKMTILDTGLVGIGIASPGANLHVNFSDTETDHTQQSNLDHLVVENDGTTTNSFAALKLRSHTFDAGLVGKYDGTTNSGRLAFMVDSTSSSDVEERMTILESGNVGIGTTSPSYDLSVRASSAAIELGNDDTSTWRWDAGTHGLATENATHIINSGRFNATDANTSFEVWKVSGEDADNMIHRLLLLGIQADGSTGNLGENGFGGAIDWQMQDANNYDSDVEGRISVVFEDVLNGIEDTYMEFSTEVGGDLTRRMRITSSGDICDHANDADLSDCASDARLKENITDYGVGLEQVLKLNPVEFNWNENASSLGFNPKVRALGLVAQEVEEVIPEWVSVNADGYKKVDGEGNLKYVLIRAIQQQQEQIEELKQELEQLKT